MLGKPRIRLNNLKTIPRFPCLGLNPIIDSINLAHWLRQLTRDVKSDVRIPEGSISEVASLTRYHKKHRMTFPFTIGLGFLGLHRKPTLDSISNIYANP